MPRVPLCHICFIPSRQVSQQTWSKADSQPALIDLLSLALTVQGYKTTCLAVAVVSEDLNPDPHVWKTGSS